MEKRDRNIIVATVVAFVLIFVGSYFLSSSGNLNYVSGNVILPLTGNVPLLPAPDCQINGSIPEGVECSCGGVDINGSNIGERYCCDYGYSNLIGSPVKCGHPRIWLTEDRLTRLRADYRENLNEYRWDQLRRCAASGSDDYQYGPCSAFFYQLFKGMPEEQANATRYAEKAKGYFRKKFDDPVDGFSAKVLNESGESACFILPLQDYYDGDINENSSGADTFYDFNRTSCWTVGTGFNSMGGTLENLAVTFDWIYDTLTPEELYNYTVYYYNLNQRETTNYLGTAFFNGNAKHVRGAPMLAIAGFGIPEFNAYGNDENIINNISMYYFDHLGYENRYKPLNLNFADDIPFFNFSKGGGTTQGLDYGSGMYTQIIHYMDAVATASNRDLFVENPLLEDYLKFHLYSFFPTIDFHEWHQQWEIRIRRDNHGDYARKWHGYVPSMVGSMIAVAGYFEGDIADYAYYQLNNLGWDEDTLVYYGFSESKDASYDTVFNLIYYNHTKEGREFTDLPLAHHAEGVGIVLMRSDWSDYATTMNESPVNYISFKAGNKFWFTQNQRDQGDFVIFRNGQELLSDGGEYDGDGGPHTSNYHWRTVAHNTLRIFDPAQERGWDWQYPDSTLRINDGGQSKKCRWTNPMAPIDGHTITDFPDWEDYNGLNLTTYTRHVLDAADINMFENFDETHTYIKADLTNAYSPAIDTQYDVDGSKCSPDEYYPDRTNAVEREFVYLRDPVGLEDEFVVVFDRINATSASTIKAATFNFANEPDFDGSIATTFVPHHLMQSENTDIIETDYYDSRLFLKTLLPLDARTTKIGGDNFRYFTDQFEYDLVYTGIVDDIWETTPPDSIFPYLVDNDQTWEVGAWEDQAHTVYSVVFLEPSDSELSGMTLRITDIDYATNTLQLSIGSREMGDTWNMWNSSKIPPGTQYGIIRGGSFFGTESHETHTNWHINVEPLVQDKEFVNFLHVLYPTENTVNNMPDAELMIVESGDIEGTLVNGERGVVFKKHPGILNFANYSFSSTGITEHLVVDLNISSIYNLRVNSVDMGNLIPTSEGTVSFDVSQTGNVNVYLGAEDVFTCAEVGGQECAANQGCDGVIYDTPDAPSGCCVGTCMLCDLSNVYWSDSDGINIEGQDVLEGTNIYEKVTTSFCGGKNLKLEIWENDFLNGEDVFDDFIGERVISVPENDYVVDEMWAAEWHPDGITDPEYYFKVELIEDVSINDISGDVGVILDTVPPTIDDVVVEPSQGYAVISWSTDKPGNSTINYGESIAYGNTESSSEYNETHSLTLSDLTPGERYYYEIVSCTSGGYCSDPYQDSFETLIIADLTLTEVEDTWIGSTYGRPDKNYGEQTTMTLDGLNGAESYILMRWDTTSLAGYEEIESAKLSLYTEGYMGEDGDAGTVRIYPMQNTQWSEGSGPPPSDPPEYQHIGPDGATFNEWEYTDYLNPTNTWVGYPVGISDGDYLAGSLINESEQLETPGIWHEFDVTSLVQGWIDGGYDPDAGFMIVSDDLNTATMFYAYASSEHANSAIRPKIEVFVPGQGGECQEDEDCTDDGLACTLEYCNNQNCDYNIQTGTCYIGGECYLNGESNPVQECSICNPSYSQTNWDSSGCDSEFVYLDSGQWSAHQDVALDGDYMYATLPYGLQSFDISDPSNPIKLQEFYIEDEGDASHIEPYHIDLSGDLLAFGTSSAGTDRLYIMDVSNPSNMQILDIVEDVGEEADIKFKDYGANLVVLTAGDNGIHTYNVNDPSNVYEMDSLGGYERDMRSISIVGDRAYVLVEYRGVAVIDISDPNSLSEIGYLDYQQYAPLNNSMETITAYGDTAIIAASSQGIYTMDVSGLDPIFEEQVMINFGDGNLDIKARDVILEGNYLYVAAEDFTDDDDPIGGGGGLAVYDINDLSSGPLGYGPNEVWYAIKFMDIDFGTGLLPFTHWSGNGAGVSIHDISDVYDPTYYGDVGAYDYCRFVDVVGDMVYSVTGHMGVIIHNHTNPNELVERGDSHTNVWGVDVENGIGYIATGDDMGGPHFTIEDFSDPDNPATLGDINRLDYGPASSIIYEDGIAYVTMGGGVATIDVSDTTNPSVLNQIPAGSQGRGISKKDNLLAGSYRTTGVYMWDVSDPENIIQLYNYAPGGQFMDVEFYDNYLLAFASSQGIHVLDITDPQDPTYVGIMDTGIGCNHNCVNTLYGDGNTLLVARRTSGVSAYTLNSGDILNPTHLDDYDTASDAFAVAKEGDKVYVADRWGITALQLGQEAQPECQADGDCNDGVSCTVDSCVAENCVYAPDDSVCDNGQWCDGTETCDVLNDCQAGIDVDCSDLYDCTDDSCNDILDTCDNIPNDDNCIFPEICNPIYFPQGTGCGEVLECTGQDDGTPCDDGSYCNGPDECVQETCTNAGPAVDCGDGVSCTVDSCNEGTESCDNLPDDDVCDDGLWCVVGEFCDAQLDCQAGSVRDCSDDLDCSIDSCDDTNDECTYDYSGCPSDFILNLQVGEWNYVSIPIDMDNNEIEQLGASMVLTYDTFSESWEMNFGPFEQITALEPLKGYIVMVSEDKTIEFSGGSINTAPLENDMWNLIGVNESGLIEDHYPGAGTILVYEWDSALEELVLVDPITELQPGVGYWIGVGDVESPPDEKADSSAASKLIKGLVRIFGYFVLDTVLPSGNLLISGFS